MHLVHESVCIDREESHTLLLVLWAAVGATGNFELLLSTGVMM